MSWIETVLDTDATSNAAIAVSKVRQILEEGGKASETGSYVGILKETIVSLRKAAEEILTSKEISPKVVAGSMILLEMRLQETQISVELFHNQADADYVSAAIDMIRGQGNKLITQLTLEEQDEVREMLLNARRMADYGYYAQHYKDGKTLLDAALVVENLVWRNSIAGLSILWGGFVLLLIVLASIPVFMLLNDQNLSAYIGFAFLVIIGVVAFVVITRVQKAGAFKDAMVVIEELGDVVDLERFEVLDDELKGNRNRAVGFQGSAQTIVEKFFKGFSIPVKKSVVDEKSYVSESLEDDIPPMPFPGSARVEGRESSQTHAVTDRSYTPPSVSPAAGIGRVSQPVAQFCGECGTKIPAGALFCPNCGNRVRF